MFKFLKREVNKDKSTTKLLKEAHELFNADHVIILTAKLQDDGSVVSEIFCCEHSDHIAKSMIGSSLKAIEKLEVE